MKEEKDDIIMNGEDLDDSVVAEESAQESIKKLRTRLKESEAKAKEYLDGWQRERAEMANARKRDEEARRDFAKFAQENLVAELVPVLDSFSLALAHGNSELEPVYKQLMQVLGQNGLEESNPEGEPFDPRLHEAVGTIETENKDEDHKILEVVQKGYILSGKIIRPAKVKVGEFKQ